MPVELEAKVKVDSLAPTRQRLLDAGAERLGAVLETNTFFDTADRALLAGDRGLRLRIERDPETKADQAKVTYKGPRQPGPLKARHEIEFIVADPFAAEALFNALGFRTDISFEKRRESWRLGGCRIELDEMPLLGTFVEIEGPDAESVESVRLELGLSDHALITDSYVEMLVHELARRGGGQRVVRF